MEKILSFDTSSKSTGWAYYEDDILIEHGVILGKNKDSISRIREMIWDIYKKIDRYLPHIVIVEETVVVRNPQVQRMLTIILGAILGKCVENNIYYEALRPTQWRKLVDENKKPRKRDELKQWSKNKVSEMYNINYITDDESDAILIGIAYLNKKRVDQK